MTKLFALLVTVLAILLISTTARAASLYPLVLDSVPQDSANFSAADNQIQLSLALGLRSIIPQAPAQLPSHKLSLRPNTFTPNSDFVVGHDTVVLAQYSRHNWQLRPNFEMRDEWNFLRRQTLGPDGLERFADMLDIDEQERPWSTTTTVHLLAPMNSKDWIVPFATIAHEIDADEDFERFGIGAGAMLILGRHMNFGAEIIHYGGNRSPTTDAFSKETQFMTRLQVEF